MNQNPETQQAPKPQLYAVVDIETGGFSKTKNGLAEIAVLIIDDEGTVHDSDEWLILPYEREDEPGVPVSYMDAAMHINGLTLDMLLDRGMAAQDVCKQFTDLVRKHDVEVLIGHNAKAFDIPWLEMFFNRFGSGYPLKECIDTIILAKDNHKGLPSYKLVELCKHFSIEVKDLHTAKGDIHATAHLYWHLTRK